MPLEASAKNDGKAFRNGKYKDFDEIDEDDHCSERHSDDDSEFNPDVSRYDIGAYNDCENVKE
ncbi:hypothetical protein BDZ45DRAFT_752198 [Acephala macrosclerotiorum]|nr:hypothetical protein BDZ45DRAFT_752198 [Acephala macrosclerotiorum]